MKIRFLLVSLLLITVYTLGMNIRGQTAAPQATLILEEARTVYLGNLARAANGVPPLRWNRQLTEASRWFSWDSVENRPEPYCGHQDTNGQWPIDRALIFGYLGFAGAENAFCGYVTPQQAIEGWMNSPGHRANLLDPNSREIGLGYYRRDSDGRGYVTQMFGVDAVYPPVIINREAITTTTPTVPLYIHDRSSNGGFTELGPATQMMISNEPCFVDAEWETYVPNKTWALDVGQGWREVYVKTLDSLGRTATVSDTIYLGANVPLNELSLTQAASTASEVTLYGLEGSGLPFVQMSPGWIADDTYGSFNLWWGNGHSTNDPAARGGSAFILQPGAGESFAWVYTTNFIKNTPFVAYARLKVNDNSSPNEVARFSVSGGGTDYGPLSIKGTDFAAPNQYQEFALPFIFHDSGDVFLIFNFWRSGPADVYVDGATIFTSPTAISSPLVWQVPGGNYRGQGVWIRYTNGAGQFSELEAGQTHPSGLSVSPTALVFLGEADGQPTASKTLTVNLSCGSENWQITDDAGWLHTQIVGGAVRVWVDPAGMGVGTYHDWITLSVPGDPTIQPVEIPVTFFVLAELFEVYLPLVAD